MAGEASALVNAVVAENDEIPGDGTVAGIAGLRGRDVLDGELGCAEAGGVAVAGRAIARGAAKYALGVAGFATCLDMLSGQEKAGGRMIEGQGGIGAGPGGTRRLGMAGGAEERQPHNQQDSNGARKTRAHPMASPDGDRLQVAQHEIPQFQLVRV